MTIKPKKKASKDKNESHAESVEGHSSVVHPHGHYHHAATQDEPHSALTQNLAVDFDGHELGTSHKRRHRSSPHRTVRKHRTSKTGASPSAVEFDEEYNSEDEHTQPATAPDNVSELEQWFEQALSEKKGFMIKKMGEDGACLFRAVADQVYGDQEMHGIVRKQCLDYMQKNAEFYSQYVTEDFTTYINRKKMDKCHGNHLEIQAMTELFNRPVEVYQYSLEPMNTFDTAYKTDNPPIRLSYHGGVHYNSIVDPYCASIGVGLGLPGYQPGLADRNLMRDAIKSSEAGHIEQTMLEDKLRETDWEVTQDSIEEQVARESYLQWLREQEKATRRAKGSTKTATCSSTSELSQSSPSDNGAMRSPRQLRSGNTSPQQRNGNASPPQRSGNASPPQRSGNASPPHRSGNTSPQQRSGNASSQQQYAECLPGSSKSARHSPPHSGLVRELQPSLYGLSDWGEEDILAQVIAQSQQEYLDNLKHQHHCASTSSYNQSEHLPGTSASTSYHQPHHTSPPSTSSASADPSSATSTSGSYKT